MQGWVDWLNVLHATTRPHIIEDDVLWQTGAPYQTELVEETARNLRRSDTFSLVALVPVVSADSQRVDVLAITRDTWSLRPSAEFDLVDGVLTELRNSPIRFDYAFPISEDFSFFPGAFTIGFEQAFSRQRRVAYFLSSQSRPVSESVAAHAEHSPHDGDD